MTPSSLSLPPSLSLSLSLPLSPFSRDYCSHLKEYSLQCSVMIDQLSSSLHSLHDMSDKHQLVSEKTQALHDACEQLVQEQVMRAEG